MNPTWPTDEDVRKALRAECAVECSLAVRGGPGVGCYGECKRTDFDADDQRRAKTALVIASLRARAALAAAKGGGR